MSSLATGDIAGIAIGGVLAVVTIIGIVISIYAMCCKKEPSQPPYHPQQQGQYGNAHGQQMNTRYYGQQQPYHQHPAQQAWTNPSYGGDSPPSYNAMNGGSNFGGKY